MGTLLNYPVDAGNEVNNSAQAAVVKLSGSCNSPQHRVHTQRWYLVLDTTSGSLFVGPLAFLPGCCAGVSHPSLPSAGSVWGEQNIKCSWVGAGQDVPKHCGDPWGYSQVYKALYLNLMEG